MTSPWALRATGGVDPACDVAAVRSALALLADPAHGVELRALPSTAFVVLPGSDLDGLVAAAARLSLGAAGVYYALNPVPATLDHRTRKADVLRRRWLFFDMDAVRAEGFEDQSATDAEKAAARESAGELVGWLTAAGWPSPLLIDSGNGFHVLYRVDFSEGPQTHASVKRLVYAAAARLDTPRVKVDKSVHNPARIAKLPGTVARKGDESPDRPYRPVKILHRPEEVVEVTWEQLVATGGDSPAPPPPSPDGAAHVAPFRLRAGSHGFNSRAYAARALAAEEALVKLATPGTRNIVLNLASFNMGQMVGPGWIGRQEVESALEFAAIIAGLDRDPQCGLNGIRATIKSGIEAGMAQPRPEPPPRAAPHAPGSNGTPPPGANGHAPAPDRVTVRASAITTRKVEWLWPGRIPLGKLTTFAGVGGLGKTFVLCDLSARVSVGGEWPCAGGECATPGQVLFISGEDDPDDTLVPRLIEMGADLDRIRFLTTQAQDRFTLADLPMLDRAVAEMGGGVRFVAVDPPTAYLGGVNDHKNAELRQLLTPLKNWTAKHRLALVFNTHVTKPQGAKVEAMMRVMGSVAWVNAVRAAHMFARDPDDPDRRLCVPMKNNLGPERKGLAYRIVASGDELAKVEWGGEVDTTADQAVGHDMRKVKREVVAADWLVECFRERLEWPSDELFRAAKEHGVSHNALFDAKKMLDLPKARKVTHENGNTAWVWWVPPDWPQLSLASVPPNQKAGTVGTVDEESI
jgi:putative DNA primase/helicase